MCLFHCKSINSHDRLRIFSRSFRTVVPLPLQLTFGPMITCCIRSSFAQSPDQFSIICCHFSRFFCVLFALGLRKYWRICVVLCQMSWTCLDPAVKPLQAVTEKLEKNILPLCGNTFSCISRGGLCCRRFLIYTVRLDICHNLNNCQNVVVVKMFKPFTGCS